MTPVLAERFRAPMDRLTRSADRRHALCPFDPGDPVVMAKVRVSILRPAPDDFGDRTVATTVSRCMSKPAATMLNIGVTFLTGVDAGARSMAQRGTPRALEQVADSQVSGHDFEQIRW